jgi:hypothetical protein
LGELYEIGAQTLIVLRGRLRPFVEQSFAKTYPDSWRSHLGLDQAAGAQIGRGTARSLDDPDNLIALVINSFEWDKVFRPLFGMDQGAAQETLSFGHDIRRMRSRYALHAADFSDSDAWRLIDSTRRLLQGFGLLDSESQSELERLSRRVQPGVAEAQTRIDDLRRRYLSLVANRYEHIDFGGIAPSVDGQVVRLRLDDVYIAPTFMRIERTREPEAARDPSVTPAVSQLPIDENRTSGKAGPLAASDVLLQRRVLVVGGAGAGKSTFARYVARSAALGCDSRLVESGLTPVVVLAAAAADAIRRGDSRSLLDYLEQRLTDEFGAVIAADVANGKALLLVDGIDEVGDAAARLGLGQAIEQFAAEHPDIAVIATARPVGYRDVRLGPAFVPFKLQSLDDEQVARFVQGWFAAVEPDLDATERDAQASRLIDEITATSSIHDLAGTPLLLTIIALVSLRGGALPSRRVELFRLTTQTLLRQWPLSHGFDLDEYELRLILGRVATRLVSGRDIVLRASELRRLLETELSEIRCLERPEARLAAESMIRTIEVQTGFLVEQGVDAGEPVYGFIHRSFAEYLAAVDLFERYSAGELALADFALSRGDDAVPLFFAYAAESSLELSTRLVSDLIALDSPVERHLHRRIHLALDLLSENVRVRPTIRDRVMLLAAEAALTTPVPLELDQLLSRIERAVKAGPSGTNGADVLDRVDTTLGSPARRARVRWSLQAHRRSDQDVRSIVEDIRAAVAIDDPQIYPLLKAVVGDLDVAAPSSTSSTLETSSDGRTWVVFSISPKGATFSMAASCAATARLSAAGVAACSVGDLAVHGGFPPGLDPTLFSLDLSDASLLGVEEVVRLSTTPGFAEVALLAGVGQAWSKATVEAALVKASSLDMDQEREEPWVPCLFAALDRWFFTAATEATADVTPSWLDRALSADHGESLEWSPVTLAALNLIPWAISHPATWETAFVTRLLTHEQGVIRLLACRQLMNRQFEEYLSEDRGFVLGEDIVAAVELLTEDPDPEIRGEGWRARALLLGPVEPLATMFGEDGLCRPPAVPLNDWTFAFLLNWLLNLACDQDRASDSHVFSAQIGKLLDWDEKPSPTVDLAWRIVSPHSATVGAPLRVPPALMESAWSRVGSADPATRAWAASVWAQGARSRSAQNEIKILLGDSDAVVRLAGLWAIQHVDNGGTWVADAAERSLREDDSGAWELLLDFPGLDSSGDEREQYRTRLLSVAIRVLDEGVPSEGAWELAHGWAPPNPAAGKPSEDLDDAQH